jgi:hypothetical protein
MTKMLPRAALSLCFGTLALVSSAMASAESLDITAGGASLSGDRSYAEVRIRKGTTLKVNAYDGKPGSGRLHLRANRIIIEADATLTAAGAGYEGNDSSAGDGPGAGKAGSSGLPGGGGAYGGDGGEGTGAACTLQATNLGGAAYASSAEPDLGSAGGAAGDTTPGNAGGRGGGVIVLEAAEIVLEGRVEASGGDGTAPSGVGSGGGAGGAIVIIASKLELGANAAIVASGGVGGEAVDASGGGGSGGLVVLRAPTVVFSPNVAGGMSGACSTVTAASGIVEWQTPTADCLDVDGDGHTAARCGGNDCDDADADVAPSKPDLCDGIDNDCDGEVDLPLAEDACVAPATCQAGECVAPDPVDEPTPAPAGARPDYLALEGGCGLHPASSGTGIVLLGGVLAALTAAVRRRR